jgi:DNA polymerase-3 subunit delta
LKTNMIHYKKIFSDVEKRDIVNLYLLHGSEVFIMEKMAMKIASSIVPEDLKAFNLTVAYGGELDLDEFIASASAFPFLSDQRVLILRELEKLRGSWKRLIAYCENPAPSSVVIFLYNPFDDSKSGSRAPRDFPKLESTVKRMGKAIAFEPLTDADLRAWVRQEAKRLGIELEAECAEALVQSVGENLFELQNEMIKLSLVCEGRKAGLEDLVSVIGSHRLRAVYELVNSIEPGGEARAIEMLQRIMRSGAERPSTIIYQLERHFLDLMKAKAGVGTGGWRYERAQRRALAFKTREIVVWLENLRRAELLLKTGSFPEEALLVGTFMHAFNGEIMEYPLAVA